MVSVVPKVLSSMANATISVSSAFFPSDGKDSVTTSTGNTSTSSGITLDNTNNKTAPVTDNSPTPTKSEGFFASLFGGKKASETQPTFIVSTSTKPGANTQTNNTSNNSAVINNSNQKIAGTAGTPDLAVQITSIGTNNSNGAFVATNNFTTSNTVVIKFKVENQGKGPSGPWSMKVNVPSSNANDQVKTLSSGSIPAGAAVSGQAVFNTPAAGLNQQVTVSIDPNGSIIETSKNNNQASVALNVNQINNYNNVNYNNNYNNSYNYNSNYNNNYGYNNGTPNLTIRMIAVGKIDTYNQFTQNSYLRTSDKVAVKFEVTNNSSTYTSSWFWKSQLVGPNTYNNYYNNNSYYNGYTYNSDGSRSFTTPNPESGLAPGETKTYTTTFDGLTYGSNYITINVDSSNNITESNEGDNTISQSFFVNY